MVDSQEALVFFLFIVLDVHSQLVTHILQDLCRYRILRTDIKAEDRHGECLVW